MTEPFRAEHAVRSCSFQLPLYVRCTPGSRIATVSVLCVPLAPDRCEVAVTYAFTGLGDEGNAWVRAMDASRYEAFIGSWKAAIDAILAGG